MGVKEKLGNLYYKYKIQPAIDKNGIEWVRQRLYDNLNPVGYWEPVKRVNSALDGNMYSETPEQQLETGRKRDDIFAEYLSIPQSQRHNVSEYIVQNSDYVPTKQANQSSIYKKIPLTDEDKSKLIHDAFNETFDLHRDNPHGFYKWVEKGPLQISESKVSESLGTLFGPHTVSRGFDNNGDYISYYDYWDIAPISGKGIGDETKGIGKPVEFYDRIYLDDYYDIPEEARGNPFITPSVVTANAKHENGGVLKAQSKGQGLLFSEGLTDEYVKKFGEIHPFRREHERYDYYAVPNFNRQNTKHLFGWDLRKPVQWDVDNIYLEKGGKL